MIKSKFKDNQTSGSGEEDYLRGLNICWHGSCLGYVTKIIFLFFVPLQKEAPHKIWL